MLGSNTFKICLFSAHPGFLGLISGNSGYIPSQSFSQPYIQPVFFFFSFKILSIYLTEREKERAQAGEWQIEREKQAPGLSREPDQS